MDPIENADQIIDETILFICLNTEISSANIHDFKLTVSNLYSLKKELAKEKD